MGNKASTPLIYAEPHNRQQQNHQTYLTLCMLGSFSCFCKYLYCLKLNFSKNLSGTLSECQSLNPGPKVIKHFSVSTQLSTKFILLLNVKMPTIVGILRFISMINIPSERHKARNFFISILVYMSS